MIDIAIVQECLSDRVGFRQPDDPQSKKIASSLIASESGLYFQDVHALVTIENIKQTAPEFDKFIFDNYNSATTYSIGDKVASGLVVYESLTNANIGNSLSDITNWKLIDPFSAYLEKIKVGAIGKVLNRVIEAKKLRQEIKTIFEDMHLYEGWGNATNLILKESRFCFFEFSVKRQNNLSIALQNIWTQLNQINASPLTIYVYHSSQYEPIFTQAINPAKAYSFVKTSLTDIVLKYTGGRYYVGYYEDDLTGQAIKKNDYDFSTPPCGSCNNYNATSYTKWSKYISVNTGYVKSTDITIDRGLWDLSKNVYEPSNNFGLNFSLTVQCELSGFICQNNSIYDNAIQLQVGVDVLTSIGNSTRNNAISEQTRKLALFALDNRDNGSMGLNARLDKAIQAVDFDLSGLGDCLPCKDNRKIRYSAI